MTIALATYFILLGTLLGRADGDGINDMSKNVIRFAILGMFTVVCATFAGWWSILTLLGVFGVATGHGQYFLDRILRGQKETAENTEPLVKLFFGPDWRVQFSKDHVFTDKEEAYYFSSVYPRLYWRNVFGMFVTGALVGLPATILSVVFGQWLVALLFLLTGPAKAVAYMIGYRFSPGKWDTVVGEYVNGCLRAVICVGVLLLLL